MARRKMENMTDGFVLHLLGSLPGYLQWDDHPLDHSYDIVRVSPLLAEFLVQTRIIPFLRCTATPLHPGRERDACYVDNESISHQTSD